MPDPKGTESTMLPHKPEDLATSVRAASQPPREPAIRDQLKRHEFRL